MTKSNSHAKALSAEILQNLSTLLAESARADDNHPGKQTEESLYQVLQLISDEMDSDAVASASAENIAKNVLERMLDKSVIAKLVFEIIEDYIDAVEADKAYQEHIKSGGETISHEELMRRYGLD